MSGGHVGRRRCRANHRRRRSCIGQPRQLRAALLPQEVDKLVVARSRVIFDVDEARNDFGQEWREVQTALGKRLMPFNLSK
jgi:hypothetical protein